MGALPLSVVHSDDMLRLSATLIGNPVPLSAGKLVEQFTERVDHSTSDKKHYDPEHIIHMLLKVGYRGDPPHWWPQKLTPPWTPLGL